MSSGNDDPTRTARQTPAEESRREPRAGDRLGRYVIRDVIGRGGMGVVFRASDPELGRDVAIKVLLPGVSSKTSRDRLLGEARAMAKLRHPAVLPVFDVGTTEHGVFVAMPLVAGGTLRDWLKREPRTWHAVVDKFLTAGRGLSAAHAAGLVHRDFKPTNVLLESDGLVQVADFGIASMSTTDDPSSDRLASSVAGTPAYMAPEQASGKMVDGRADQFSFCVSLWEGLYGERPGDAATETQRTPLSLDGVLATGGGEGSVPGWLRAALLRGLAFRPEDRWPSLDMLLAELERHTRPPRGQLPWVIASVAVVVLGGVIAFAFAGETGTAAAPSPAPVPQPPPQLAFDPPTQLTTLGTCAENPSFITKDTVVFDVSGVDGGGVDLFSLDVAGGEPTRITDGPNWDWRSRPGRKPGEILYLSTSKGEYTESYIASFDLSSRSETSRIRALAAGVEALGDDIYYADINGGELRKVSGTENTLVRTYDASAVATFTIHPSSRRIAYVGSRGGPICHHVLDDGKPTCSKVVARPHAPAFSPSGHGIYVGNAGGVHRIDVASGEESKVLDADASGGVAISSDGRTVVYSTCRPTMRMVDLSTKPETVIMEDSRALMPAVSAAGHLAWTRSAGAGRVLVFRAPGGQEQQLTSPDLGTVWYPSIDPTGNKIAFTVTGEKPGVYVVTTDPIKSVLTRQTTDAGDRAPTWFSATGIAFERRHQNGPTTTHRIDAETGDVLDVADPNIYMTSNPATGELLMLTQSKRDPYLWLDPITGRKRRAPRGGPSALSRANVSPNGRWLVVQGGAANAVWLAKLPDGNLELVHEETGGRNVGNVAVDDQGRMIATPAENKGELYAVRVRSGEL